MIGALRHPVNYLDAIGENIADVGSRLALRTPGLNVGTLGARYRPFWALGWIFRHLLETRGWIFLGLWGCLYIGY